VPILSARTSNRPQTLIRPCFPRSERAPQTSPVGLVQHEHPRQPRAARCSIAGELQDQRRSKARLLEDLLEPAETQTCTATCIHKFISPTTTTHRAATQRGRDNIDIFGWLNHPIRFTR